MSTRILGNETAVIFLCYAKPDRERVKALYDSLVDAGFAPWMDEKNILPGEYWPSSIRRAMRRADFFLACISQNSITRRGYLQKEIKEGLEMWKEKLEDDIYLIPVRLEECELPQNLASFQCLDLFEDGGLTRLSGAITEGLKRRRERAGQAGDGRILPDANLSDRKHREPKLSAVSKNEQTDLHGRTRMSACGLFGGRDAILRRMTQLVRDRLLKMSMARTVELEKALSLPSGSLHAIVTKGQVVDYDFFERLSGLLDLSIIEALGPPEFHEKERSYWEQESANKSPMMIVAKVGGSHSPKNETMSLDLEFYTRLRALSELAQA